MISIWIMIGGFTGAVLRYSVILPFGDPFLFPADILMVNMIGCFLLAFLNHEPRFGTFVRPDIRTGITTGAIGSFTTFSAVSHDALSLLQTGAIGLFALYVTMQLTTGLAAAWLGMVLGMKRRQAYE